jgi:YYY domain-containing protein
VAESLRWYLALVLIGGGGLLPSTLLFARLRSAGVLYARPLALFGIAYVAWMLSHFGIAPYGAALVAAVTVALWAWSAGLAWRRPACLRMVAARWRLLLVGEVLFIGLFALIAFGRSLAPAAINTEKPMDLMVLTAVHEARSLPPPDPWLAGERISYYHLGHTAVDVVGQLSANGPGVAFNLGLATAGALAGLVVFGLAGDVIGLSAVRRRAAPWVGGACAVIGLLWVAPVEGVIDIAAANGIGSAALWQRLGVGGLPGPLATADGIPTQFWWWWRATRVLPQSPGAQITEFPAFSLLLGDLHAHVLALPLGLVAVALALVALEGGTPLTWRRWLAAPGSLALAALLFAALFMTNSWDVLTFGALWFFAAALAFRRVGWSVPLALVGAVRYLALPTGLALLGVAPFLAGLQRPPLGIAPVFGEHSDPARFLLIWLAPLLTLGAAALLLARAGALRAPARAVGRGLVVAAVLVALWALALLAIGEGAELAHRGSGWITIGGLALATAALFAAARHADPPAGAAGNAVRDLAAAAWLGLAAAALGLVLLTELVRIADAFSGRTNTIFKFWFHAWALIAIAGGAGLGIAFDRVEWRPPWRSGRWLTGGPIAAGLAVAALVTIASLAYAPAMAVSRSREGQARGLDALAGIATRDPDVAAAAAWARRNLDPAHDVLLQAFGDSYTPAGTLAATSGVPTLLEWLNHERQWRGLLPTFAAREQAINQIYTSGATAATAALARRWGVDYIYLGREEQVRYGPAIATRFDAWPVVFRSGDARIIAVPGTVTAGGAAGATGAAH